MTPLTMPQSGPTKLKPSTEAPRETTAARFLFPRRRCSGRLSARGVSGTAIRRRRGVVRRFRVASTSSTKLSTSCVSYPWPTGARQKAIARTSSGVRCYASSNAPRQRPGRHRPHPSDSRGSWREDLKTGYGNVFSVLGGTSWRAISSEIVGPIIDLERVDSRGYRVMLCANKSLAPFRN